ncbi:MFS transporter [Dactylosporangium sp. NPDC005572]|uniref:MFS transporter n=1 Tax=Dactylosporangium sp. NPDC005572 TaxID=3156889 RepID=UPI0033B1100F
MTRPAIRTAASVLVTAQVVMATVMTAAPLHLHHTGSSLTAIGLALSAHTVGMFALAPLTGRLTDRIGDGAAMLAGLAAMGGAAALVAAGGGAPALFALGLGWNLCFVAGSSRLARDVPAGERTRSRAPSTRWSGCWRRWPRWAARWCSRRPVSACSRPWPARWCCRRRCWWSAAGGWPGRQRSSGLGGEWEVDVVRDGDACTRYRQYRLCDRCLVGPACTAAAC